MQSKNTRRKLTKKCEHRAIIKMITRVFYLYTGRITVIRDQVLKARQMAGFFVSLDLL